MKWFKHETERSAKVDRLLMEYGVEGYGLFQYCREIIAGTIRPENLTFELEHDAELIAYQLKMDTLRVEKIMKRCTATVGIPVTAVTAGAIVTARKR